MTLVGFQADLFFLVIAYVRYRYNRDWAGKRRAVMMRRFLLIILTLISTSVFGEYLKGVYPPEIAWRDADGYCYFSEPVLLDLKIPEETQIVAALIDSNGITFPISWSWFSQSKFKGVWGFDFPFPTYNSEEWFLWAIISPANQKSEQVTIEDHLLAISCPPY